jgi:hypothetical protein
MRATGVTVIAAIALCQARYIDEATKRDWMTLSTPQLAARFGWTDQYQVLPHKIH